MPSKYYLNLILFTDLVSSVALGGYRKHTFAGSCWKEEKVVVVRWNRSKLTIYNFGHQELFFPKTPLLVELCLLMFFADFFFFKRRCILIENREKSWNLSSSQGSATYKSLSLRLTFFYLKNILDWRSIVILCSQPKFMGMIGFCIFNNCNWKFLYRVKS